MNMSTTMIMEMMKTSVRITTRWQCCVMEGVVSGPHTPMRFAISVYIIATVSNNRCIVGNFLETKFLIIISFQLFVMNVGGTSAFANA